MSLRFKPFLPLLALALAAISPARAADSTYIVADVHVDATAASPAEASNAAIAQGRPRAWQILYRRLARQQDWARQPMLDPATLQRLSRGYTIANERRSTTRYVADVTYMFNPDAVAHTLQAANIPFAQGSARRTLIVPMSPTFQAGPWAQALNAPQLKDSAVPFTVAGASDAASLKDLDFNNAAWDDVAGAARSAGASEVTLVQAVYANNKVTVNVRRLGPGEAPVKASVDVPLQQSLGTTYPSAALAAIRTIEDMWKGRAAIDFSQRGRLAVNVRMNSLADWGAIQNALAGADNVTGVTVTAMDIGYAQVVIAYQGSPAQLRDALGGAGLALSQVRGNWTLALNGAADTNGVANSGGR